MYFDDICSKGVANLPLEHPYHYLEDVVKRDTPLRQKEEHDKEHEEMLSEWGCDPKDLEKLTFRPDSSGVVFEDRMYHLLLHLRYWKEKQIHDRLHHVSKFEADSGYDLDQLTLPAP